VYVNGKRIKH